MPRIDYVIRFVRDLEACIAFYRDVLGLPLRLVENGYAEFATENVKFGLFERSRLPGLIGRDSEPGEPGGEIVLVVEDVDGEAERLRAAGVEVLKGPLDRPWGHRTLHVADPDGQVVELAEEIPRSP